MLNPIALSGHVILPISWSSEKSLTLTRLATIRLLIYFALLLQVKKVLVLCFWKPWQRGQLLLLAGLKDFPTSSKTIEIL